LGTDLVDVLAQAGNYEVIRLSHREVECTDAVSVEKALKTGRPDVVVNCAAFVRVDEAEDRAEEALRVNGLGALNVARPVRRSTPSVFTSARTTYLMEGRAPVYGERCAASDQYLRHLQIGGRILRSTGVFPWLVVRMASLFGKAGSSGKGGNFVETILAKAKAGESLRLVRRYTDVAHLHPRRRASFGKAPSGKKSRPFSFGEWGNCTWYEFAAKLWKC